MRRPFIKEPEDARIQFADVAELKEPVAQRLRQWLAVVLPAPQLAQTAQDRGVVVGIGLLEFIEKFLHWVLSAFRLVKLYGEFHEAATSNLMLCVSNGRGG